MAQPAYMQKVTSHQHNRRSSAWVECTKCKQWRRVPSAYADRVEEHHSWTCAENPDTKFNSCTVPQEISSAEIDAGDPLEEEEEQDAKVLRQPVPAVWQCITRSIYTYRRRKKKTQDTTPICCCKPPADGERGCGEGCLNRMLGNECNPETCPCGDQCGNSMFARRQYANITQKRAGSKGFGLYTQEDLKEGQFIIEYIGEVLADAEYARRKKYYLDHGQRHYYFMSIGNGETIDACRKGNLGRFINHSCDPNCKTEKWTVADDELAIGLFAIKDIPAGTELTFNYNFERYGDKPVKCLCGSANCSGYMGGRQSDKLDSDPNKNIVSQDDAREAEEEAEMTDVVVVEPEPIMVEEGDRDENVAAILDAEVGLGLHDKKSNSKRVAKLAGSKGIAKVWDSDSDQSEDFAETGSKGSMNLTRGEPASSRGQSDAESMQSSQHRRRLHKAGDVDVQTNALKRIANGAAYSRQEKRDKVQQGRASPGRTPSGKRRRPSSAHDSSPSTSSAHHPHDKRLNKTLSSDVGTSSALNKLQRRPLHSSAQLGSKGSEVARRLESMVFSGNSMLRGADHASIVKLLRLFNLCDLGFYSETKQEVEVSAKRNIRARVVHNATEQSQDMDTNLPARNDRLVSNSSGTLKASAVATASGGHSQAGPAANRDAGQATAEKADTASKEAVSGLCIGKGLTVKVMTEEKRDSLGVSPAVERLRSRGAGESPRPLRRQARSRSLSPERPRRRDSSSPFSRDTDTESGEVKEPESPISTGPLQLSNRQRARLADTSLLLNVILRTDYAKAPQQFVACGVLRQLHTLISRCLPSYTTWYDTVMLSVLKVVKDLPFSADDIWHTRNAQGTFGDALAALKEARKRLAPREKRIPVVLAAENLLNKYPRTACLEPLSQPSRSIHSPRPSTSFSSPHQDRTKKVFDSTPPSRQPSGALLDRKPSEKHSFTPGRIVDWTPPGSRRGCLGGSEVKAANSMSRPVVSQEKAAVADSATVASQELPQKRAATLMRPEYMHTNSKSSRDQPVANGHAVHSVFSTQPSLHGSARMHSLPGGGLPGPPAGGTPLGRSHSFSGAPSEVQHGTPHSARPPHRLHMARGPSSPPGVTPAASSLLHHTLQRPSPSPPGTLPPPPMLPNFLPPPPAVTSSLQLPHMPGPAPPKGPSPPKGPAPPSGPPPATSSAAAEAHMQPLGPTPKSSTLGLDASQAPPIGNAAPLSQPGNAASKTSTANGIQPPLPIGSPSTSHKLDRSQIASPASSFTSLNPPPLPCEPPPVSPAVAPLSVECEAEPPGNPSTLLVPGTDSAGQSSLPKCGRKRSRWEQSSEPDSNGMQHSALQAVPVLPGLLSIEQQGTDAIALPGPPDLPQQPKASKTSHAVILHNPAQHEASSNGTTRIGPSPLRQRTLSSRESSPLQDQDGQHHPMTEDDFPAAWTELDGSFDRYLEFAITRTLAKFDKAPRKLAGGDHKIIRRCKDKVIELESKNLQQAQALNTRAMLQRSKLQASVALLVEAYCTTNTG